MPELISPDGTVTKLDDSCYEIVELRPLKRVAELRTYSVKQLLQWGPHRMRTEGIFPLKETLDTHTGMIDCEIVKWIPEEDFDE